MGEGDGPFAGGVGAGGGFFGGGVDAGVGVIGGFFVAGGGSVGAGSIPELSEVSVRDGAAFSSDGGISVGVHWCHEHGRPFVGGTGAVGGDRRLLRRWAGGTGAGVCSFFGDGGRARCRASFVSDAGHFVGDIGAARPRPAASFLAGRGGGGFAFRGAGVCCFLVEGCRARYRVVSRLLSPWRGLLRRRWRCDASPWRCPLSGAG